MAKGGVTTSIANVLGKKQIVRKNIKVNNIGGLTDAELLEAEQMIVFAEKFEHTI